MADRKKILLRRRPMKSTGNVYFTGYTKEYVKIAVPKAEGERKYFGERCSDRTDFKRMYTGWKILKKQSRIIGNR